jgi:hypothetical protein
MRYVVLGIFGLAIGATAVPISAGASVYASRRECRHACSASISTCRLQAASARDRRRCKTDWIKACSRFLGPSVCSPPDLRGTWEFDATVTDPPNPCAEPVAPVVFSLDTQGSFDLTGVAQIGGAFSDMPFSGTMIVNPEIGVGFSIQGHGDQFSPCYLERNIGAGDCPGTCERNGSYAVREFCNGSPNPVCQWGAAGTIFRRP